MCTDPETTQKNEPQYPKDLCKRRQQHTNTQIFRTQIQDVFSKKIRHFQTSNIRPANVKKQSEIKKTIAL